MSYVTDWLKKEIKLYRSILNDKTWAPTNADEHKRARRDMRRKLNDCTKSLSILKAGNKNES